MATYLRVKLLAMLFVSAVIADIPLWILSNIVTRWGSLDNWLLIGFLYFIISILSSAFSGFVLTSRLRSFKTTRLGFDMTLLTFNIYLILNVLLGYDIWIDGVTLVGFIIGFAIGARTTEIRRRIDSKISPS